jgi:anti-sigma regulatory factor (Ser/Thr protein kinase)
MANPYKDLSSFQAAWMEAWANSVQHAFQCWRHMFELQQNFLQHAEKHHRSHIEIASGASFMDRYGRRSHDIDPERDV